MRVCVQMYMRVLLDIFDIDAVVWVYVDLNGLAIHRLEFALKESIQKHQGVLDARFVSGNLETCIRENARVQPDLCGKRVESKMLSLQRREQPSKERRHPP